MEELTAFLKAQSIMQIAPQSETPWIANLLMVAESPRALYFVGSERTHYGQQLRATGTVAFATAWHASDNHTDRKGVQGVGVAHTATDYDEIAYVVSLHNAAYPEFREQITPDWVSTNTIGIHLWRIEPTFIKFWNDALYGRDGCTTFTFEH